MVTIVTHADDGNLCVSDQADHLLQEDKGQRSVSRKHDVLMVNLHISLKYT